MVTTTTYDIAGRVTASSSAGTGGGVSTVGYTYLDDGRVSTITLDGAQVAGVGYDPVTAEVSGVAYGPVGSPVIGLGSLVRTAAGAAKAQAWTVGARTLSETVVRSQAGRVKRVQATDSGAAANAVDWSYSFDAVGRLTSAVLAAMGTRPAVTLGYGYAGAGGCGADPAAGKNGSRTSTTRQVGGGTVAVSAYCTDGASRLTGVTSSTGGLTVDPATIVYDGHGNATQVGSQSWSYDGADRVTGTSTSGITPSQTVSYVRDVLGRVAARTASGVEASTVRYGFTSTDDSPDLQLSASGAIVERYVPLPGGVLHRKGYAVGATGSWSVSNLHGDVIATVTGGAVTAGFVYDPFGQPLNPASGVVDTSAVPVTRTGTGTTDGWAGVFQRGYEHTGGLSQTLMGARTYLPALGMFTATDPVAGGNTTTYTYPQDPINNEDYSGESMCGVAICGGGYGASSYALLGTAAVLTAAYFAARALERVRTADGIAVPMPQAQPRFENRTYNVYEITFKKGGKWETWKYGITGSADRASRVKAQMPQCRRSMGSQCSVTWHGRVIGYGQARLIEYGFIVSYVARHGKCPPGQARSCK